MVRFILLVLSLTVFAEVGVSQSTPPNKGSEPERVKPVVNVQDQPGTPLKIAQVETKWATPDQQVLEIYVRVENVSDLEIRTYVWRMLNADGSQDKDGCFTHTIQSPDKILKPGDSDGKSTWRRFPVDSPTASINLSVDYVEFGNNTTWGLNVCHSAENLADLPVRALAGKDKFAQISFGQSRSSPRLTASSQTLTSVPDLLLKGSWKSVDELKSHGRVNSNRPDCNLNLR